jgi:hypothetical protein
VRSGASWSFQQRIGAFSPVAFGYFGGSAAMSADGDTLGVPRRGSERLCCVWSRQLNINPTASSLDVVSYSVALSTPWDSSSATGVGGCQAQGGASDAEAAFVYVRSGVTWAFEAYIKARDTAASNKFGFDVALSADGNTLVVGACNENCASGGVGRDQTQGAPTATSELSTRGKGDFGAISGDGNTMSVGQRCLRRRGQ